MIPEEVSERRPPYLDPTLSFEDRAVDLVSRLTTEEKVAQMLYNAPAIARLGIPSYNWWNEALHGVARAGTATVFPQAIAMAATFDASLLQQVADIISTEGRAKYHEAIRHDDRGIYKGLTFWSPNINIFRDPRWGRGHETYGEDPWLTSVLGCAFVRGLQGDDPRYLKAAACAKHFAVHSGPESERHSFDAQVSLKDLWETYLPAFRALVVEAGVESVMGAYNRTNGEPCCGSPTLLEEILRGYWAFDGHVTSDCWALQDFHLSHGVTRTAPESAALALNSGCDLNCGVLFGNLLVALQEGLVDVETIDRSVRRLFVTRLRLGMFDPPESVPYTSIPFLASDTAESRSLARDVAGRSLVLLKNDSGILPLDGTRYGVIGVIGPNSDHRDSLMGNYAGTPSVTRTILQGIQESVPEGTRVLYAQGCHLFKDRTESLAQSEDRIREALSVAYASDVVILCLGLDPSLEGEEGDAGNEYGSGDKPDLTLPGNQQRLMEQVHSCGKPVILVHVSGSAMDLSWADENLSAILQVFYPGAEGGRAVAQALFGKISPAGRLPVTFYRTIEELPRFDDYSMKGRTYRYMEQEALYSFGYGLSYSKFSYSDPSVAEVRIRTGDATTCSVLVQNTGERACRETVQLYLSHESSAPSVPRWSLKGVRSVWMEAGEAIRIEIPIGPEEMSVFDEEGRRSVQPGRIRFHLGGGQPDDRTARLVGSRPVTGTFDVEGNPFPLPR